jgi:AraC-like DNA-binding protein
MVKMMEKLVDRHIRDQLLELCSLHRYQLAYQPGKSTETALHHVITQWKTGKLHLELSYVLNGASDGASFDIITEAAKGIGLET